MHHYRGGETLEQVAQRSSGFPILGGTQDQVGWGPGQLELMEGSQTTARGLERDDLQGLFQLKPFYIIHSRPDLSS